MDKRIIPLRNDAALEIGYYNFSPAQIAWCELYAQRMCYCVAAQALGLQRCESCHDDAYNIEPFAWRGHAEKA